MLGYVVYLYDEVLPRAAPLMNDGQCKNLEDIANIDIYYGNKVTTPISRKKNSGFH